MLPPPHLNDYLKRILPLAGLKQPEIVKASRVPYLTLAESDSGELTEEDVKAIGLLSEEDSIARCPFDEFRYCMDFKDGAMFGYVRRRPGSMLIVNLYRHQGKLHPWAQIVTVYPQTNAFSGVLDCQGRIIRTADMKDVTDELQKILAKGMVGTVDKTPDGKVTIKFDTNTIKDPYSRKMVENLPENLRAEFLEAAIQHEVARSENTGVFMSPEEYQAKQKLEEILGKLPKETARKIALQMKEKTQQELNNLERDTKKLNDQLDLLHGVKDIAEMLKPGNDRVKVSTSFNQADANEVFIACYRSLMGLCYEYTTPSNFMAQVTPRGAGKSVEWVQAREHYTVIHRHHEANQKGLKEGAVVKADPNKQLKRTAHTRRAHTRLLKAAKWTYMRGQRVKVRATWCGPKEWQDTAGQTYKILIPVSP